MIGTSNEETYRRTIFIPTLITFSDDVELVRFRNLKQYRDISEMRLC